MRILAIGPLWRGSNAGGLFRALSRQGCIIEIIDEFYYVSLRSRDKLTKIAERLLRNRQVKEFNNTISASIQLFKPDILFVYKGAFVLPETILFAKEKSINVALFYPDVSMEAHGGNIPKSIPLYEQVFTTKTFGINDLKNNFNQNNATFIPHGFDPEIHRKINITDKDHSIFDCDASFIGTWSPKKELLLTELKKSLPDINLKIWGGRWGAISNPILQSSIQKTEVLGDLYTIAIQCSKINLGILSEKVTGASSGDLITSRTFHIPGSSGFMLHERNEESVLYFDENKEAAFFEGAVELISKVQYYLEHENERLQIGEGGYLRALKDHSLDSRALVIIGKFQRLIK